MPFIILTAVISIGVAIFAIQNAMSVPVNFFIWHGDASLVLVILGSFLAGILWELFCRMQLVGETLYLEYPFILRCISLFILSVLKLTSIPKCKLHKRR